MKTLYKILIISALIFNTFLEKIVFGYTGYRGDIASAQITNDTEKPKPILISIGAEVLPSWFFETPKSDESTVFSVGISDPEIEDSLAMIQATHRAFLLAGLMMGTDISGIFDDYQNESGKKCEEMNKIKNLYPMVGRYFVSDSFRTRFKEKVVLLKFVKNTTDTIKFSVFIDFYKSQVESNSGTNNFVSITSKYKVDTCRYLYSYEQSGNDFSITSVANKRQYEIPLGLYQYMKVGTDEREETIYLQHKGLWYGYYQAFIDGLAILTSTIRSRSKTLGQYENQNNQKQLAREIMNNKLIFNIDRVTQTGGKFEISMSAIK